MICNSCLCVLNNRLPRLARYLQAVFIVTNSFGSLNKLELLLMLRLIAISLFLADLIVMKFASFDFFLLKIVR